MEYKFLTKFVDWQKKKYSGGGKILLVIITPVIFLFLILSPSLFLSAKIDERFSFQKILPNPLNFYLGIPIFVVGFVLYLWTILLFFRIGKGTQTPFIPTQKIITSGPYKYSRNPMVLGVILFVTGLGIIVNSFSFIGVGLVIPSLYLISIKLFEEKELAARFGKKYIEYKRKTPFLIPLFRKNS